MKKIGNLYGKPVVIGDPNEVNEHQLLAYDTTPIEVPPHSSGKTWRVLLEDVILGRDIKGADIVWDAIVKAIETKTYKVIFREESLIPGQTILIINGHNNFYGSQDTFLGGALSLTLLGGIINGAWGAYNLFVIASNEDGEIFFIPVETGASA